MRRSAQHSPARFVLLGLAYAAAGFFILFPIPPPPDVAEDVRGEIIATRPSSPPR